MLELAGVAAWLLSRGLVGPEAILDDDLIVRDVSSRNRNFMVETSSGGGFVLKQGLGAEAAGTVANEAAVYRRLASDPALAGIAPAFCGFEAESGVLVLRLVAGASTLRNHHSARGRFSASTGSALGNALGTLHARTRVSGEAVPAAATWVLLLDEPPLSLMRDVSAATLELLRIVQGIEGMAGAIAQLRAEWRPEALIHGDMKWENCLITMIEDQTEQVILIDWESGAAGDPGWDIGSALAQYLSFWLFSMPATGGLPTDKLPELAAFPLDPMKPALAATWMSYREALGVSMAEADDRLVSAVRFAGARLIQTAFEMAQMQQQLSSSGLLHLQVAHNVLLRPEEAAVRLLGLPRGTAG